MPLNGIMELFTSASLSACNNFIGEDKVKCRIRNISTSKLSGVR